MSRSSNSFAALNFHNHFEGLGENFFKRTFATPLNNQRIVSYSKDACQLIDLDPAELESAEFLAAISGTSPHPKFCNLAQAYSGHQFGHFVPSLGDGRAMLLAQIQNHKNDSWDMVLKGCGLTPFSRPHVQNADGRAVLRSSIREYLISEHLAALAIPTSRALCLIASDQIVMREMPEQAAQIIRLAPSHLRFGTFEYFFYRKQYDQVKILADYAIQHYFPNAKNYAEFLTQIVKSTAHMIAHWQAFGFCHGVLNTDNMSIHGITFDFGPFAFLDEYDPHRICNHSDIQGRYSFINQPQIGLWNLYAFAVTLSKLVTEQEQKEILENYETLFLEQYHHLMATRIGFSEVDAPIKNLIYSALDLLHKHRSDYNFFFRNLENFAQDTNFSLWFSDYKTLLQKHKITDTEALARRHKSNPQFILRNHLLQIAIQQAENGDFSEVKKLQEIFSNPFAKQPQNQSYADLPPSWAKEICISCSS